jgi:hypothetical protein
MSDVGVRRYRILSYTRSERRYIRLRDECTHRLEGNEEVRGEAD